MRNLDALVLDLYESCPELVDLDMLRDLYDAFLLFAEKIKTAFDQIKTAFDNAISAINRYWISFCKSTILKLNFYFALCEIGVPFRVSFWLAMRLPAKYMQWIYDFYLTKRV